MWVCTLIRGLREGRHVHRGVAAGSWIQVRLAGRRVTECMREADSACGGKEGQGTPTESSRAHLIWGPRPG